LAEYMKPIDAGAGWEPVAELMVRSAEALKRAGADFLICPDNTIHEALPFVLPLSPLPWLHIAEEVGKEAQRRGLQEAGNYGNQVSGEWAGLSGKAETDGHCISAPDG
jgi:aspartate racemase